MRTYQVTVTKDGRWWLISVPAIDGLTQARKIGEIEQMARELIAVTLDVRLSKVRVSVVIETVGAVEAVAARARKIEADRRKARQLNRQADEDARRLARELAAEHVTVRDIGTILGLSHQRAHQLTDH